MEKISRQLSQYEREVTLGVRLTPSAAPAAPDLEDVQDIDCYLSTLGFEFVDAAGSDISDRRGLSFHHLFVGLIERSPGIPGVPRIIDALSTIMWPSMTRKSAANDKPLGAMYEKRSILSESHCDLVASLLNSGRSHADHTHRLQELASWLDEDAISTEIDDAESTSADDENTINIWSTSVTPGNLTPRVLSDFGSYSCTESGFDDDFTAFVSALAPDVVHNTSASQDLQQQPYLHDSSPFASSSFSSTFSFESAASGTSTPNVEKSDQQSLDSTCLTPSNASFSSYRTLGSVSDFGDLDNKSCHECKDSACSTEHTESKPEDDEIPTTSEIAETSRRIFGSVPLTASPTVDRSTSSLSQPKQATLLDDEDKDVLEALIGERGEDDEVPDLGKFDLQGVLGALQELKEEIAGMSDDKARRKEAARVALGLVYGLDVDR